MKSVLLVVLSMAGIFAQVIPGRYVVELSGEPAALRAGRQVSRSSMQESEFTARRAAVRRTQASARQAVAQAGGTVIDSMDTVVNALIVSISDARAAELSKIPGVVKVHTVRKIRPLLSHALPLHKVPDAWNLLPQGQNSAGAGIKIGMIDTGIDVNHPAFSDTLPALDGFPRMLSDNDKKFTNAKIIVAKNFTPLLPDGGDFDADDYDGHGTGTATAAAGGQTNTQYGPLSGVAPKAYVGSYKVLDANGSTSDVIAKAIDEAVADGMDVISISIGGIVVFYSDIDATEIGAAAIENATKAGIIVTVAAGNSGPGAGTLSDYANAPDAITVGAIMNDRSLGDSITLSGVSPYESFPGDGSIPSQPITAPLFDITSVDSTGLACSPLPAGSAAGTVAFIQRGTCTFEVKVNNAAAAGATAAIIYNSTTGTAFSFGSSTVGGATLPTMFTNLAEGTDLKARVAANSGASVTLDFSGISAFRARTDVVDFSSRGPSLGSALKPDLVAVGEEIVTGAQSTYIDGPSYDPSGFIDTAGTSFSTPLVAGAAAVLKGARPGLTFQQYRSLLINGASPATSAEGVSATVSQAGAGMLNLAAGVSGTVAAYPTSLNFGTGAGSVNTTLNLTLTNVGTVSDTFAIGVAPSGSSPAPTLSANSVQLDPNGSQQISVNVNASGLTSGEYQGFLQVTGSAGSGTVNIPYWFAVPGSDPAGISIIYSDSSDPTRTFTPEAAIFRVVDIAGLPYSGSATPTVTIGAGGGSVQRVYRAGDIPGIYVVDIRTGTSTMQLNIAIGSVTTSVVIPLF